MSSIQTSISPECFRSGTTKVAMKELKLGKLGSTTGESGTGKVTTSYVTVVGALPFKFRLTSAADTYTASGSTIDITRQAQAVTPAPCGVGGTFSGTFSLMTPERGGAVTIA